MRHLALVSALLLATPTARAQDLTVGVLEAPPFAMQSSDGAWMGMAVDMWRVIAERQGWSYRLVALDVAPEVALDGAVDIVLPVQATPGREAALDLSLPIYTATLGVATPLQQRLMSVAEGFLSWQFLRLVAALSALLLVVGALVWLIERRRNPEQFAHAPLKGLGDGFWWAGVTMTTIGYGDKAPVTPLGRAVAMLWMLTGLAVSAALTAAVVTLSGIQSEANVPETFANHRVAVAEGSTAAAFLASEGVDLRPYPGIDSALEAAATDSDIDVAAGSAPLLRHALDETGGLTLNLRTTSLDPQMVTFAVADGSDLREPLNRAILALFTSETGWTLTERYTGE